MKQILCFCWALGYLPDAAITFTWYGMQKRISPAADPSLTAAGEQRAVDLANLLKKKKHRVYLLNQYNAPLRQPRR